MPEERVRGIACGMSEYLTKPVQLGQLEELIQKIRAQQQQRPVESKKNI